MPGPPGGVSGRNRLVAYNDVLLFRAFIDQLKYVFDLLRPLDPDSDPTHTSVFSVLPVVH